MTPSWEKIAAVERMQAYILRNYHGELRLRELAEAAAYSPWHALRAFCDLTGKTPFAYLRGVRLTEAAKRLRDGGSSVLDIALDCGFGSHEGFAKAFYREYGLSPSAYRETAPPIRMFSYYPVSHYYLTLARAQAERGTTMSCPVIFTQIIQRPARRLILKRGRQAREYFAYCEEVGCDIWGILESVKGALYESVGLWLPEALRAPGTSEYCQGVEMPADYDGPLPEGFDCIDLPACTYLLFQGEPFPDEKFGEAVDAVSGAIKKYDPKSIGWEWAPEVGPRFQLPPMGVRGYMEALPVRKIEK